MYNNKIKDNINIINSKFGELAVNTENTLHFFQGLIGMPKYRDFCLANIDDPRFVLFKALQSLEDHALTFLVFPISENYNYLTQDELQEVQSFLQIKPENFSYLLIASTKMIDDKKKIIVNKRAPLFLDTAAKTGIQYVLPNAAHEIQFLL